MAINYAKIQNNHAQSHIEDEVNTSIKQITDTTHAIPPDELTTLLTNPTEIKNAIKHLPINKAAGPDEIPNLILKNLTRKHIVQLTYVINAIVK